MHVLQNILLGFMLLFFFIAIYLQYRYENKKKGRILRMLGFVTIFTSYTSLLYLFPYTFTGKEPAAEKIPKKRANFFLYGFYVLMLACVIIGVTLK